MIETKNNIRRPGANNTNWSQRNWYLRSVLLGICLLLTKCATFSIDSQESPYSIVTACRIAVPTTNLVIDFPSEGFKVKVADPSRPYYFLTNEKTGIAVSFNFERAEKCNNSQTCRDYFAERLGLGIDPNKKDWRMSQIGDVFVSDYMDAPVRGIELRLQHMNAHYVKEGIWIDVHLSKGNFKEADRELFINFVQSIEFKLGGGEYYLNRGSESLKKGQYDQAISDFNKALEIDPRDAGAYISRGSAYSKKGQYDQAISDFNKALEINPRDAVAYSSRADAYMLKGQYDQAISDCNKAFEIAPKFVRTYVTLGQIHSRKGQYDQAILNFDKALELAPKFAMAYYERAIAHCRKSNFDKSWQDVNKAQQLGYQVPEEFLNELRKASGRQK